MNLIISTVLYALFEIHNVHVQAYPEEAYLNSMYFLLKSGIKLKFEKRTFLMIKSIKKL